MATNTLSPAQPDPDVTSTLQPQMQPPSTDRISVAPWGFVEEFSNGVPFPGASSDQGASAGVRDGQYVVRLNEPNTIWAQELPWSSDGRNVGLDASIASVSGSGSVVLALESQVDQSVWAFLVDPSTQEWSVALDSPMSSGFFTWVVPKSFSSLEVGSLENVEVQLVDGTPTLLVNGIDVVAPSGVALERIPGRVAFRFGASGTGFEVAFEEIRAFEL